MSKVICFDLEGPLSPQDNAYEVMGLFGNGLRIFETISRYDDLLALEDREGYEAGDTLVNGARELISQLKEKGWETYIISTSYEQHAYNIGNKVGVPINNISCTSFPLERYEKELEDADRSLIEEVEQEILEMYPPINDLKVKLRLDRFFFSDLPENPFGRILKEMSVMGGARKVKAAENIAEKHGLGLKDIVVIGDSITDFKMLKAVNEAGGLAVAFNANRYAIPHATVGLATKNMKHMEVILDEWEKGGREGLKSAFSNRNNHNQPFIHVLEGMEDFDEVLTVHKKIRNGVRGRAAKLG
jgi:energy-converting hydrogenase A subunit R